MPRRQAAPLIGNEADGEAALQVLRELLHSDKEYTRLRAASELARVSPMAAPKRNEGEAGAYDLLTAMKTLAYEAARSIENADLDRGAVTKAIEPLLIALRLRGEAAPRE